MKSYTDLEQSKKLAEILPIESADMRYDEYTSHIDGTPKVGYKEGITEGIPCWSLSALLNVLPYPSLAQHANELWSLTAWVDTVKPYSVGGYDNKIDACVAMIEKLHELKML